MFSGFGTPEDTNRRFRYLLAHGQTGLSTAFDMPTLMGFDPDDPLARGEVGREGVSVASVADIERLFADIPLDQVTTSMTINAPAVVLLAFYVVAAERRGIAPEALRGTIQNDMLKEFIAQKEWICGVRPSLRIIRDMLVTCTARMPLWNTISISGYHIREAGATAVQELAFTLADGIGYVELGRDAGLDVDVFAPRLSFFWDIHNDFFEEIAKLRAARRMWAGIMRDRFGAKNPRAWMLRAHAQTAGVSLVAQQPLNNVVRTTLQALAAVLGGTQSLHTNSFDETLRAADRGGGDAGAAHAADHRRRVGRAGRRGSVRWQLLPGIADRPHASRSRAADPSTSTTWAASCARSSGLAAARDRSVRLPHAAADRQRRAADRRRQPPRRRRSDSDPDIEDRHDRRSAAGGARAGAARRPRRRARARRAGRACGGRAPVTPTSWTPWSRRRGGTQLWVKSVGCSATSSANIGTLPRSRARSGPNRMPTPGVGQDIEAMCGRCGQVWHVVMAKMGDKIAKVVCKRCGGHHRYRDENATPRRPRPRPAGTRLAPAPAHLRFGAARAAPRARRRPPRRRSIPRSRRAAYAARDSYVAGERVAHPTFGVGVVAGSPGAGKVEVVFGGGVRVLACAKVTSTLARPVAMQDLPLPDRPPK